MKKRILSSFLMLAMLLSLIPAMSFTASAEDSVTYIDRMWDGEKVIETERECTDYTVVHPFITTFEDGKWYVVNCDWEIEDRIQVTGTVNLILADGVTLTAGAGIGVSEDNTLKIFGQSGDSGILEVSGLEDFAAIGGGKKENCGTVIINVTSFGSWNGAGIGGGYGHGTLTLGENVFYRAGNDAENITVTGDSKTADDALGKSYFYAVKEYEHSGGTATCQAKAICEICGEEYGDYGEHFYGSNACTVCGSQDCCGRICGRDGDLPHTRAGR